MSAGLEAGNQYDWDVFDQSAPSRGAAFYFHYLPRFRKLREAPYDTRGIPLPIIPSENFPNIQQNLPAISRHHEYFLPGPQQFISWGGVALRGSRILKTETFVHNGRKGFHKHWDMSPGPRSRQGRVSSSVFSLAYYLPEEGIDLWSGDPVIRPIERGERDILTAVDEDKPNFYRNLTCSNGGIRTFFEKSIPRQDFINPDPNDIEVFATAKKIGPVKEIGHTLLDNLINSMISDVRDSYEDARLAGLLHPTAPADPAKLVWRSLGHESRRDQILLPLVRRNARVYLRQDGQPLQTGADELELAA